MVICSDYSKGKKINIYKHNQDPTNKLVGLWRESNKDIENTQETIELSKVKLEVRLQRRPLTC